MAADRLASVAGVYEHPARIAGGRSAWQLKAESAAAALADAGLAWTDVDALFDCGEAGSMPGMTMAEYLGVHPRIIDTTAVGGSSFEVLAGHAARLLANGRARVALITYGSTKRSGPHVGGDALYAGPRAPFANMELPWGLTTLSDYALVAARHRHQYGTTPEQFAEIAVATRSHALRNPVARAGLEALGIPPVELSLHDVVTSRPICDPLRLLDCCLINDGAGAVVLVAPELVHDTARSPVWIIGAGEATSYLGNGTDITRTAAAGSGADAFGEAGVRPDEIDVALLYDSFTVTVLTALEDLGFCGKGEGGDYVTGGRLRFDCPGGPALNTDGGGLSSSHPGMRGLFLIIEATRQLRGESTAQVPGARLAVAHGNGGWLTTRHVAGTVVLARD